MSTYKVKDIRKAIRESANEFKPVLGNNVVADNKKNNQKAYKDILKSTDDYNKIVKGIERSNADATYKYNYNKGMQDLSYHPDTMSKPFSERVKAQMDGYTSAENEKLHKNDAFGNAIFGLDTKAMEKRVEQNEKDKETAQRVGLVAREHKKYIEKGTNGKTVLDKNISENREIKRLHFKNTEFLSENHMKKKIPDDYKKDGNVFIMEDNSSNRYKVSWNDNAATVLEYMNTSKLNEQMNKIQRLFGNSSIAEQSSKRDSSIDENKELKGMIDAVRKI